MSQAVAMAYIPLTAAIVVIGALVGYALYLTKDPRCLWALLLLIPIAATVLGK